MNAKIYLKKNEERRIKAGHLWVFSNEIAGTEGDPQNGDLTEVYDYKKYLTGTGFYNKNSLIALRLISSVKVDDLKVLFRTRLTSANELRKKLYPGRDSYRMVFSESDFLPGLIIDKYNSTFVMQVYSAGMEKNIDMLVDILKSDFSAENIFTKNEEYLRKLEGIDPEDNIYLGERKREMISDGLIKYEIDFEKGQKTGFYFDQSDNRFFIEKLAAGKTVLDAFCNSGGFGLHAAKAGAVSVDFIDSSANEIQSAENNFKLNELSCDSQFTADDVFDFLEKCINEKRKFDIVMIDPPAFAKNRKTVPVAKKGYERLNRLAIQSVKDNGFLVTSSCSHHIKSDEFLEIINNASIKTGRKIQLVQFNSASLDHPQIPSMPETTYLKFAVFRIA
ncbi:MAG TPA: class I SAM-dependent rRNA methyltransferase [Ignavibacteriaceae bacterium]|nr:class I SAM-dependent rRNA methyltransferase [Ignavibacteriaceae bacterium]